MSMIFLDLINNNYAVYWAFVNQVVMPSVFGLEGPGSIPVATKNQPSACDPRAGKFRGTESLVVGL